MPNVVNTPENFEAAINNAVEDAENLGQVVNNAANVDGGKVQLRNGVEVKNLQRVLSEIAGVADGIQHSAVSWDVLKDIVGVSGEYGFVPPSDGGTHTDPVTEALVNNEGIYQWASNGLGSLFAQRIGSSALSELYNHINDKNNPHQTTFAAVLSNAELSEIVYVSPTGENYNNGESTFSAVKSIEQARDLVENSETPKSIYVYPGTYVTQGHIDFPDNCRGVVAVAAARSTRIVPAAGYEVRNVFRMGDGGYVQGFSFEGGWRIDSLDDPTEGFAVAFRPGALIRRTVYIHNVAVYREDAPTLIPPPLNRNTGNLMVGNGSGVCICDGRVPNQYSPFPQMMLWGATPVSPNGIGYLARNGGFINGINAVGLWAHKGYMALDGGEIILTNCATQFGDWSMWAEGSRDFVNAYRTLIPLSPQTGAANTVAANKQFLIDGMWDHLVSQGYTNGFSQESASYFESFTRKDADFLITALLGDLSSGQQEGMQIFAEGMFNVEGNFVGNSGQLAFFIMAWEYLRDAINSLSSPQPLSLAARTMVTALFNEVLIATVTTPNKRKKPSLITSLFHQFNSAGAGVNKRAFRRPSLPIPQTIVERSLGRVVWNGQDDSRRLYLNESAVVNGLSGQLEGPAIDRTILPRAARAAIIAGGQI